MTLCLSILKKASFSKLGEGTPGLATNRAWKCSSSVPQDMLSTYPVPKHVPKQSCHQLRCVKEISTCLLWLRLRLRPQISRDVFLDDLYTTQKQNPGQQSQVQARQLSREAEEHCS